LIKLILLKLSKTITVNGFGTEGFRM